MEGHNWDAVRQQHDVEALPAGSFRLRDLGCSAPAKSCGENPGETPGKQIDVQKMLLPSAEDCAHAICVMAHEKNFLIITIS